MVFNPGAGTAQTRRRSGDAINAEDGSPGL